MTPNDFLTLLHSKLNEWPEVERTQSCDGDSIFVHLTNGPTVILKVEEEVCEDRGYRCCETLTPQEHMATYGYPQAGVEVTRVHKSTCVSGNNGPEWSGTCNPDNPDEEWICDECGAIITAPDAAYRRRTS